MWVGTGSVILFYKLQKKFFEIAGYPHTRLKYSSTKLDEQFVLTPLIEPLKGLIQLLHEADNPSRIGAKIVGAEA